MKSAFPRVKAEPIPTSRTGKWLNWENGIVKNSAGIYDNLTYAEAQQIAGMWTQKKDEAEGAPS
jgi:hypothetical protein